MIGFVVGLFGRNAAALVFGVKRKAAPLRDLKRNLAGVVFEHAAAQRCGLAREVEDLVAVEEAEPDVIVLDVDHESQLIVSEIASVGRRRGQRRKEQTYRGLLLDAKRRNGGSQRQ